MLVSAGPDRDGPTRSVVLAGGPPVHTRIDGHHLPRTLPAHAILLAARTWPLRLHLVPTLAPGERPRQQHTRPTAPYADTAFRVSSDYFHGQDESVGLSTSA